MLQNKSRCGDAANFRDVPDAARIADPTPDSEILATSRRNLGGLSIVSRRAYSARKPCADVQSARGNSQCYPIKIRFL